jgi:peptidyl-prolyl cis-trans isomerase D
MITWMQRHKKWLIITIWISTIAFIGAGFVGWGQYSYGNKAGAIAKVGDIEITQGELQKAYANLYMQYNRMLQGNFDEEKAKQFGLQKQAFEQLKQQALLLNLAKSYDLMITDIELFQFIKSQKAFYKNGVFDKETYKSVLAQNRLTPKEYETALRKELLVQKTLKLLPVQASQNETKIMTTLMSIADKINYKILTENSVKVAIDDEKLKAFWEGIKNNFVTQKIYEIVVIKQKPITKEYTDAEIEQYYQENKMHFRDTTGKILPLQEARSAVITEMNDNATKKAAKYTYLKLKKGTLPQEVEKEHMQISATDNKLSPQALQKIQTLSMAKPYAKPLKIDGVYYVIELVKVIPSRIMSFEEAKAKVLPLYIQEERKKKLLALANKEVKNFVGKTSAFITADATNALEGLSPEENAEFLQKLFLSKVKRAYITLNSGKIVLYNILEQKLLTNKNTKEANIVMKKVKENIFHSGMMKELQRKYKTEIYVQGL